MGPYCNYCERRCFVYFPQRAPEEARAAYQASGRGFDIIATCREGQKFEKLLTGWCYDDIKAAIAARNSRDLRGAKRLGRAFTRLSLR